MRPITLIYATCLMCLTACHPTAQEPNLTQQVRPYEQLALQRMDERLSSPDMVGGGPLTRVQLHQARDQWLETIQAKAWLGVQGMRAMQAPLQDDRWEKAFTGSDTSLVVETLGRIHARQASESLPLLDERQAVQDLLAARANVLDAHTQYVPAAEQQDHNDRALRRRVGVGIVLAWESGDGPRVESLTPEAGPTVRKQVQKGDLLKQVRHEGLWKDTAGQPPLEVIAWLRGTTGSTVALKMEREGRTFDVAALRVRQALNEERLQVHRETGLHQGRRWTWLRLELKFFYEEGSSDENEVTASAAQEVEKALKQAGAVDGVVVDLRRCRGGAIEQALDLAGLFTGGGAAVNISNGSTLIKTLESPGRARAWSGPVQVWVGPNTASSGEALAMALHDRIDAPLVGWSSYGKGTLQRRMELDMQAVRQHQPSRVGELWWTFGVLAGPKGESWQKHGLPLDLALPNAVAEPWGERAKPRVLENPASAHASSSHLLPIPTAQEAQAWNRLHATNTDGKEFEAWKRVGAWVWTHRQSRQGQ